MLGNPVDNHYARDDLGEMMLPLCGRAGPPFLDATRKYGYRWPYFNGELLVTAYSVADAKNRLSSLIDKALAGEEVIITRHGKPVVELRSVQQPPAPPRGTLEWLRACRDARPGVGLTSALRDRRPLTWYLDAKCRDPDPSQRAGKRRSGRFHVDCSAELWVSDFAAAEVASALSRLVRTGDLRESDGAACLSDFDVWRTAMTRPAETHAADVRLAGAFVRKFDLALRVPDALHLAIARRLDVALVTLDRRTAAAARELGVAVEVPKTS